ncbi:AAA family ATPase [Stenotrophomonas maltophilia]|uniref:AAA family ATPase n=1 Tax=Stenotrophomonas lactitubi TaxID=2045214 RepID=UPI00204059A1|nr:AAA family ATPase [Stenotrophomonas lactitubi]MCO7471137.1 AAA family ATPase [Stenotrophomonas maltophilia]
MSAINEISRPYGPRPHAMHIDSIRLVNFRCHKDLTVNFNDRFNVIVAVNGGGKTSLLRAICTALAGPLGYAGISAPNLFGNECARVETQAHAGRYRFDEMYPVDLYVHVQSAEHSIEWTFRKENAVQHAQLPNHQAIELFQQLLSGTNAAPLPVFAFYSAGRVWPSSQTNHLQAAVVKNSRIDGYEFWWDASQATSLSLWLIAKCLERMQTASEMGGRFNDAQDDELALVNSALAAVLEHFRGIRFDMKRSSLLVEWTNRVEPDLFNDLSDGQRSMIFLVADIARRICLLNPQLGMEALQRTPGVVLIDELDVHLHPHWQRLLVRGLKAAFPSVQFITASHSPQIIGELHPDEIILLSREGVTQPQVSYGLTSSQVLEDIMGAEARTPEVERKLEEIFDLIEQGLLDQARAALDGLARIADGVPELDRARSALKRREIIGR